MPDPSVTILDVGHGLCGILQDEHGTVMFDAPHGDVPRTFLRNEGINKLDAVFISHHHEDHCAGMTGFLGDDFHVRRVFFNSPQARETQLFGKIVQALDVARRGLHRPDPRVLHFEADVEADVLRRGRVDIAVVGPDALRCRSTRELSGKRRVQTDHSLCGVARIDCDGRPRVLLTGDLNDRGLEQLLQDVDPSALAADVLVYPHHGGASDVAQEGKFARTLGELVSPQLVVFSLARDKARRPHPAVMDGLRESAPQAYVVCTQLSRTCDEREVLPDRNALPMFPGAGVTPKHNHCCGGSVQIQFAPGESIYCHAPDHASFVEGSVPTPLCRVPV